MGNDLISRTELLNQRPEYLNTKHVDIEKALFAKGWNACNSEYYSLITDAADVDAEPVRHARWIPQDNTRTKFSCSDCGSRNHDGSGKYCSLCGAKMDGDVDEQ